MIVNPNSDIILYSGMPLDDTYSNTIYFSSRSAQTSFFTGGNSYEKRRFTVNTYQRVNEGVFDANCLADEIYDCNYMAFRNTNFGNKWFYAFINSVEYVNNAMARVSFTIDVMQTYFFEAELQYCFVEREHSVRDDVGWNIVPEPLNIGEYVFQGYNPITSIRDSAIIVAICDVGKDSKWDTTGVQGNMYDGVYGGVELWAFPSTVGGVQGVNTKLKDYLQKPDAICNMYMAPAFLLPALSDGGTLLGYGSTGSWQEIYFDSISSITTLDGYTPKNNKLFTYPFNYFHVDNGDGSSLALRYEFFQDNRPRLLIEGNVTTPIQVTARPIGYKGLPFSGGGLGRNAPLMTETLTLASYPLCSWNYDTYQAWVAQNAVPMLLGGLGSVIGGFDGMTATEYPQGYNIGKGQVGGVIGAMSSIYSASIQADTCRGNISSGNANFANQKQTFYTAQCCLNAKEAQIIDDFFSRYGYATNLTKIPNRHYRPHWNYVKTNGCDIIGQCPSEVIKELCSIYDNGITFWNEPDEVGNYLLDNSPT